MVAAPWILNRWPRPIRGQFETLRGTRQGLFPEAFQGLAASTLQPFPMPVSEVAVVHGQGGQLWSLTARISGVGPGGLAEQHADAPGVPRDVVQAEEQAVPFATVAQQGGAQQGGTAQIEGTQAFRLR